MNAEPSTLRGLSTAVGAALVVFGAWYSWREFRQRRDEAMARMRLSTADSLAAGFRGIEDSLCQRAIADTLSTRDAVGWTIRRYGLTPLARGRLDRWDWGCLGLQRDGFALLVARDSGCARFSGGELWSDDCHVSAFVHDLRTGRSTSVLNATITRSLWKRPSDARICHASPPVDPPAWDSLAPLLCSERS